MGRSPRALMGWEPASVTTYEYDGDRLVRSVTVREPEFSLTDLASLLENRADALAPRGSHGHLLAESMDPNADAASWSSEFRYKAVGPRKDHAQAAMDAARKEYEAKYPDADTSALRWAVEREDLRPPDPTREQ